MQEIDGNVMSSSRPERTAAVSGVASIERRKSSVRVALMAAPLDEGADVHASAGSGGSSCAPLLLAARRASAREASACWRACRGS